MATIRFLRRVRMLALAFSLLASGPAFAQPSAEYRVKAGFLYNFIAFTEWPAGVGSRVSLCIHGGHPFGGELHALEGKTVNGRTLSLRHTDGIPQLKGCQVVFVARAAIDSLPRIVDVLHGEPVLIVADSPGALDAGAGINLLLRQDRVAFEVNLGATREARLALSSKLLRLASEVRR